MLRTALCAVMVFCVGSALCAQEYDQLIDEAEAKYSAEEYMQALDLYHQAFQVGEGSFVDFFNAACTAALAGEADIAFDYLARTVAAGIVERQWFEEDEDLVALHSDPRWHELMADIDARRDALVAALPETHPDGPGLDLPQPNLLGEVSVEEALQNRRSVREYEETPLSLAEVSQLLWSAYGLNKPIENAPDFLRGGLRTAPSAGALYPLEVYLVARNVTALDPGIYWYKSDTHQLINIKEGDLWQELSDAGLNQVHFETASAAIVYSAVFERNTQRYGERGRERYVCMDLGHSAENVYLQAFALGVGTCAIGAFNDLALRQTIGMTQEEEPLYIMPLGKMK